MANLIAKIDSLLKGKKTYLGAAALAVAVFLLNTGKIDQHTYETVQGALIAWGFAALRASK